MLGLITSHTNAYYDRPNTLSLFSEIVGKRILDAACGPGKYTQILYQNGASDVVGFDISPQWSKRQLSEMAIKESFFVHDLDMPIPIEEVRKLWLYFCALALHYLEDTTMQWKNFIDCWNRWTFDCIGGTSFFWLFIPTSRITTSTRNE